MSSISRCVLIYSPSISSSRPLAISAQLDGEFFSLQRNGHVQLQSMPWSGHYLKSVVSLSNNNVRDNAAISLGR